MGFCFGFRDAGFRAWVLEGSSGGGGLRCNSGPFGSAAIHVLAGLLP